MTNWRYATLEPGFDARLATIRQENNKFTLHITDLQARLNLVTAQHQISGFAWGLYITNSDKFYTPALIDEIEQNILPALHGLVLEAHQLRTNVKDLKRQYPVAKHHPILLGIGLQALVHEMLNRHIIWMFKRSLKKCKKRVAKRDRKQ